MAEIKGLCRLNLLSSDLNKVLVALFFTSIPLLSIGINATELEWKPSISTSYTQILEADFNGFGFDQFIKEGHQAYTLSPALDLLATGPVWNANWSLSRTSLNQVEDGFEDESYNNIKLNNQFSFIQKRLTVFANATRLNRNIDTDFEGVSDPIFGQNEYIEVDNISTGLRFNTSPAVDWRANLNVSLNTSDYDEEDVNTTNFTSTSLLNGERHAASLEIGYGRSAQKARASLSLNGNVNDTNRQGEQRLMALNANIGFPVWRSLDVVLTAFKSKNKFDSNNLDERQLDNENIGVGLAWRIGPGSLVEITRNKETKSSAFLTESEGNNDKFTSYRLTLQTNDNSQLAYSHSRRFYGDSDELSFNKNAKRWKVSGSYNETLDLRTRLEGELISAGIFECPDIDSPRGDCLQIEPPIQEIDQDLFYLQFSDVEYSFVDELTLIKSFQFSYDYRFKKTTIKLTYNDSSFQFLERDDDTIGNKRVTETYSFILDHRLNRRTTLKLNAAFSEVKNADNSIQRKGEQRTLSLERRLTRKATGTLSYKRLKNVDGQNSLSRMDNRLVLTYKYEF